MDVQKKIAILYTLIPAGLGLVGDLGWADGDFCCVRRASAYDHYLNQSNAFKVGVYLL